MIPSGVQIFVALTPVDMRLSFERLGGLAREYVGYEPRCGALFIFRGKRGDSIKILFYDGTGMCLFYKRLDRGRFRLPEPDDKNALHTEIEESTLVALLDGVSICEDATPAVGGEFGKNTRH